MSLFLKLFTRLGVELQPRASKWSLNARKGHLRLHAFQPINPKDTTDILMRAGNTITNAV
jgi:hypothetical protein